MDDKKMKELMIDYIDGKLTGELKDYVGNYIEKNKEAKKEFAELKEAAELLSHDRELEPDSTLKLNFTELLEQEIEAQNKATKGKVISLQPVWQIAAAVALIISGVFVGVWIMKNDNQEKEMLALKKEMEATKQLVMMSLENRSSASQRMMGVNASHQMDNPDDDIVNVLIETMNADENANVRIAAINALAKFVDEPKIRKALIEALAKQKDPIVQITLINLMIELKEKGAIDEIKNLIEDEKTHTTVKDEAHMAVFKLS